MKRIFEKKTSYDYLKYNAPGQHNRRSSLVKTCYGNNVMVNLLRNKNQTHFAPKIENLWHKKMKQTNERIYKRISTAKSRLFPPKCVSLPITVEIVDFHYFQYQY